MILENKVVEILQEEITGLSRMIKWDGMYEKTAKRIVKMIKEEIVK